MQSFIRQTVPTVTTRHHWPSSGVFGVSWRVSNVFPGTKGRENDMRICLKGMRDPIIVSEGVSGVCKKTAIP
jgi:hypothetical protein